MNAAWSTISNNPTALSALVSSVIAIAGVLLAALASILGIGLNNWFNSRRMEREHAHDREQRELERSRALTKEIYLDATAAMVRHLNAVQSIGNVQIPLADSLKVILECGPIIAKTNLVSSAGVAGALATMAQELISATQHLALKRIQADSIKSRFDSSIESHRWLFDNFKTLSTASKEIVSPGKSERAERIDAERAEALAAMEATQQDINANLKAFKLANFYLTLAMMEDSMRLRGLMRPVVRAVRQDIGYPATEETLEAMFAPVRLPTRAEVAHGMGVDPEWLVEDAIGLGANPPP